MDTLPFLEQLSKLAISNHLSQKSILAFSEYVNLFFSSPHNHIRNVNEYAKNAFHYLQEAEHADDLIDFFSTSHKEEETPPIFGHKAVINSIIQAIDANFREGVPQRLILLHGPNGSGKSSIIKKIMQGLETYSQTDEGILYAFNWVFSTQNVSQKQFGISAEDQEVLDDNESLAHLPSNMIQSLIRTELREAPYLLIPKANRHQLWELMLKNCPDNTIRAKVEPFKQYFLQGELSLRNKQIFDTLLKDYKGDLQKVFRHVQVERFYLSREKLTGLVSIEPMMQTDMTLRQVTMEQTYQMLPHSLKSMSLYSMEGDIVQGNRGVIEYNDLLKRPIDSFKYLLTTCETGRVRLGPTSFYLDSVLIGSCNEKQLDAFKEFPDFSSYKARFYLIRVPLLLNYLEEMKIYCPLIERLSESKPFTPKLDQLLALWSVMTRLNKPQTNDVPEKFKVDITRMSCLQKSYLYAGEWEKLDLSLKDKKQLKQLQEVLRDQYRHLPMYEGRFGASPRELKNIILCAYKKYPEKQTVTLKAIIEELTELSERTSEFEFLRLEAKDGYHNPREYIQTIQSIAIELMDRAFKEATEIFQPGQIEEYVDEYIFHITHLLRREKIRNPATGNLENPDEHLIQEFEKRLEVSTADSFRENILNTIAASFIDTQQKPLFRSLFPDIVQKISQSFYDEKKPQMLKMLKQMLDPASKDTPAKEQELVEKAKTNLMETYGYKHECLDESLGWLVKRYQQ